MYVYRRGFTIVELLIAIVIIAILASIGVVAYNGIVRRAETSSISTDVNEIDQAQKIYTTITGMGPLAFENDAPRELVFSANPGNTIVVRLGVGDGYCIYGYNPRSDHPTFESALVRAVGTSRESCEAAATPPDQDTYVSSAAIIGARLEEFYRSNGYYPHTSELGSVGLVIKPNSDSAFQQQLYCRNNDRALYLQIEGDFKAIYVYETTTKSVSIPTDITKTSLSEVCPRFDINPTDPGYESTGVKDPSL